MKFRMHLSRLKVFEWLFFGMVVSFSAALKHQPVWLCISEGVLTTGLFVPSYLFWYWEILPSGVVFRRYIKRQVMPFAEIVYVGPVTGALSTVSLAKGWIEIRDRAGARIIARPADSAAFIERMRVYLPRITLNVETSG
jgi:hypothetical protein